MHSVSFGKYRLIAELGHGGMADVYLAIIEGPLGSGFAKLAAVKKLRSHLAEDPDFVSMLIDEARITARLNHPNVVQMLEVGVEGDEYYLAMEYLDGQPLHRIRRRAEKHGVTIPRDAQIMIVADVLAGLHHAHELSDYDGSPLHVVHRDVTPHNVFVTRDGQIKVVDFGIAKAAGRASETKHGIVKGKVRYMSPEQALGVSVDRRSDVFAAGIMLWQAVTGEPFWGDQDDLSIVQRLVGGEYPSSPRVVNGDIPEALDAICRRALARHPEERYGTAAEMRADLESYLDVRTVAARRDLARIVDQLFEIDRVKVRRVLEGVGKISVSSSAFVAVSSGSTEIPNVMPMLPPSFNTTMAMRGAPTVPAFDPVPLMSVVPPDAASSLAPMTFEDSSHASARRVGQPTRSSRFALAVVAGAMVAALAGGVGLSLVGRDASAASAQGAPAPAAASVADDCVGLAGVTRGKVAPAAASVVYVYQTVPAPRSTHAAAPRPAPAPAPDASPAAEAPKPAAPKPAPRGHGRLSIDGNDPWPGSGG